MASATSRCSTTATSRATSCAASTLRPQSLKRWHFDTEVACCAPVFGGGLLLALRRRHLALRSRQRRETPARRGQLRPGAGALQRRQVRRRRALLVRHRVRAAPAAARVAVLPRWRTRSRARPAASPSPTASAGARTAARCTGPTRRRTRSRRSTSIRTAPRCPGVACSRSSPCVRRANRSMRYGGRPDGAAVDAEGDLWVAMYEGARIVQLAPDGALRREFELPVRCPTMPCFGGAGPEDAVHHERAPQPPRRRAGAAAAGRLRALDARRRARPAGQFRVDELSAGGWRSKSAAWDAPRRADRQHAKVVFADTLRRSFFGELSRWLIERFVGEFEGAPMHADRTLGIQVEMYAHRLGRDSRAAPS